MYICEECGRVMREPILAADRDECWGNIFSSPQAVCACGGSTAVAERCEGCGEWFEMGQLWAGALCERCVTARNTTPLAVEYLHSKKQELWRTSWVDFVLREIYGITACDYSAALIKVLDHSIVELIARRETVVLRELRSYVSEDYDDFAEWLTDRRARR